MKINTDANFYNTEDDYIRSSSLKSFKSCSWLYYANYVLKIPQDSNNNGARMGNVAHTFFECMLKISRSRKLFDAIIKRDSIEGVRPVERLIRKLMKRNDVPMTTEFFTKINRMILVGLKTDFFVEGGKIISAEYRFKYKNDDPDYFIIGTMDKIAIKGDFVIIDDFKSSKKKYEGEDKDCNLQALLYSLYASKMWPDKKPIIRFIFLQFPNDPILEVSFNANTLRGFEYYLESVQQQMDTFTENDALSNIAAYQDIPNDGSFTAKLLCGFAKTPGQLKKDGTVMFACGAKFPFKYYHVKNKDGKFVHSVNKKEDYILKEGEVFEEKYYDGCPYYNKKNTLL